MEFAIGYSYRLEKMSATLLGRIDRILSFSQLCLGATAFAPLMSLPVIGGLVVTISAFALVYQPGVKAGMADFQKKQYEALFTQMSSMSEEALRAAFVKIQESDSVEIGALCRAANNGEHIRLGHMPLHQLSWREKAIAWAAGDLAL